MPAPEPAATADAIGAHISALPTRSVGDVRRVRREFSREVRNWDGADVVALALSLVRTHRWVGYELVYHHGSALTTLNEDSVEQLGDGIASWVDVDTFGRYISGSAWQRRLVADEMIRRWSASSDRWWRRAALVSTVPLNLKAAGGKGDTARTLDICARLVDDRDDMVVKALSWALRALVVWDSHAVTAFLDDHSDRVAARVRREVTNKLSTGLKQSVRRRRPASQA